MNYDINGVEDGIALCPSCHVAFDDSFDPGLVIVPEELDFFIRYEKEDYIRRQKAAKNGVSESRMWPSLEEYRDHQLRQGKIPEGSPEKPTAGLYRVFN